MAKILKTLRDALLPSILVGGGLGFLLLPFLEQTNEIETSNNKGVAVFIGVVLLVSGIGRYLLPTSTITAVPATETTPAQSSDFQPTATRFVSSEDTAPSTTRQPIPTTLSHAAGRYIPRSPTEAATLFGGPPASAWSQCLREPVGCWTFALPRTSYRISIPAFKRGGVQALCDLCPAPRADGGN